MNEPEKQQEDVPAATDLVLPDGENSFEIKGSIHLPEKTIQAPDFCRFKKGELIPIRGYEWQVVGYTDDFMLVLKAIRMTGAEAKRAALKK